MVTKDDATLSVLLKHLKLGTAEKLLPELVLLAEQEGWTYTDFLQRLLSEEVAFRAETRMSLQIAKAKFPFPATIETFDFTFRSDQRASDVGSFSRT